jgi:hypothetical protein
VASEVPTRVDGVPPTGATIPPTRPPRHLARCASGPARPQLERLHADASDLEGATRAAAARCSRRSRDSCPNRDDDDQLRCHAPHVPGGASTSD